MSGERVCPDCGGWLPWSCVCDLTDQPEGTNMKHTRRGRRHGLSYAATNTVDRDALAWRGEKGLFVTGACDTTKPFVVLSTVPQGGLYPAGVTHMVLAYVDTEAEAAKMADGDFTKPAVKGKGFA